MTTASHRRHHPFITFLALGLILILSAAFTNNKTPLPSDDDSKIRFAHLFDEMKRSNSSGKGAAIETVGLIIKTNGIVSRYGLVSRYGIVSRYEYDNVFYGLAGEIDASKLDSILALMENDPEIDWVQPDIFLDSDPFFNQPMDGSVQVVPWGIERAGGTDSWSVSGDGTGTVTGVEVFVLDTGVNTTDINVVESISFVDSPTSHDLAGHGTHVAATLAAIDNDVWTVGMAPGANIHSIKVMGDQGEADESSVIAGIEYVVGRKIVNPNVPMVINLSLGADIGTTEYGALDIAVNAAVEAGIVVVVAAGNEGIDASTVTPAHVSSAITVGAFDLFNQTASFSNYGDVVDLDAPGVDVLSITNDERGDPSLMMSSGTSMAAPHIAGLATLILSQQPFASPEQVANIILREFNEEAKYLDEKLPPFMQYAVTSNSQIDLLEGSTYIGIEPGGSSTQNANIFTNGNVEIRSEGNMVQGFGYAAGNVGGTISDVESVFRPNYNPTNAQSIVAVDPIAIPFFEPLEFRNLATRTFRNLQLAGHYQLGTREEPAIWYIENDLRVKAATTFSGYGILLVGGRVQVAANISTDENDEETTLGIYANGFIHFKYPNLALKAQLFSNSVISLSDGNVLYGSITAGHQVRFNGDVTLYYRPASCVLTEPLWPVGNCYDNPNFATSSSAAHAEEEVSTLAANLGHFSAEAAGNDVQLSWETLDIPHAVRFEVMHREGSSEGEWRVVGEADLPQASETSQAFRYRLVDLPTGRHQFQLKRINADGSVGFSDIREANVDIAEHYVLSSAYPNPFNPQMNFTLSVPRTQQVQVSVYDSIGRRVAVLLNGQLEGNRTHTFTFESQNLPSGLYLYQVIGEDFKASRTVTLLR